MKEGNTKLGNVWLNKNLGSHGDFDSIRKLFNTLKHQSSSLYSKSNVFGCIVSVPTQSTPNLITLKNVLSINNKVLIPTHNRKNKNNDLKSAITWWVLFLAILKTEKKNEKKKKVRTIKKLKCRFDLIPLAG